MSAADRAQFDDAARKFFLGPCEFERGAADFDSLPPAGFPEVAFAGRSNVGKSTLINALTGRKALARTSNTPGRTQQINFFNIAKGAYLVDLPGYGYAKVSKSQVADWTDLIVAYLRGRATIRRVMLLIDARRGIGDNDAPVMKLLDEAAVSYQIVLTKCDKLKTDEFQRLVAKTQSQLKGHVAAHPRLMLTAAMEDKGIADLRAEIYAAMTGVEPPSPE